MRTLLPIALFAYALGAGSAGASAQAAPSLSLAVNEARAVPLAQAAAGVAVGNPLIAAVTIQGDHLLFLTGKGVGATNLVVVDGAGRTILERNVLVSANEGSSVTLQRGAKTVLHDCTPVCAAVETEQ